MRVGVALVCCRPSSGRSGHLLPQEKEEKLAQAATQKKTALGESLALSTTLITRSRSQDGSGPLNAYSSFLFRCYSRARTFLLRTVKVAVHETGHMLGIRHCTRHECGMNGSNHMNEADSRPLWFCPEDEMKIWWGCRASPADRYRRLVEVAAMYGLDREAVFWRRSQRAVEDTRSA